MRFSLFYLALIRFFPFLLVLIAAFLLMFFENPFTLFVPWCLVATTLFFLLFSQAPILPSGKLISIAFISFIATMVAIFYLMQDGYWLPSACLFATWFFLLNFSNPRNAFIRSAIFVSLSLVAIAIAMYFPEFILLYTPCIALGFLIAYSLIAIRYVVFAKIELRLRLYCYLTHLEALLVALFDCYLQPDYPLKRYVYEKRIYDVKNDAILTAQHIDLFIAHYPFRASNALDSLVRQKECYDQLFLTLLASGQLRHRVSDHTTFRFCFDELKQLKQFLLDGLLHLKELILVHPLKQVAFVDYTLSLETMEGIYEMVLQVVAKEPISFLIFIQDIRRFSKLLTQDQE